MSNLFFGYDRAGRALDAYDAVVSAYGKPAWVGRYTEQIEGTSDGLTVEEVQAIHEAGMAVVLCYNGAEPRDVAGGEDVGSANAAVAVTHLALLKVPAGVAVFLDIEAGWYPTTAFLIGWFKGIHAAGFVPGAYLNAQDSNHTTPFLAAQSSTGIPGAIWSSEPEYNSWLNIKLGVWYNFGTLPVYFHQYGENEQNGAVDLDIGTVQGWALAWHQTPLSPPVKKASIIKTCAAKPEPTASHLTKSEATVYGGDVVVLTGKTQSIPNPSNHNPEQWDEISFTNRAGKALTGFILHANLKPI